MYYIILDNGKELNFGNDFNAAAKYVYEHFDKNNS